MKKRMLALCLMAMLIVSFVYAGGAAEDAKTGMPKVELANDKWSAQDYSVIEGVEKSAVENLGYDLTVTSYPDTSSFQTVIQQSGRTPAAPGLFTWWSGAPLTTLVENGLVEDVTALWDEYFIPAGVSADLADAFTVDGKIYAAPFSILYNVIYYNKSAFETAGVTSIPETFAEFEAACDKLAAAGITPIGLKNDSWAGFIWFQQMLAAEDPDLYAGVCDGSIPYTDKRVVNAMDRWNSILEKGYFSKPMPVNDWRKQFAAGQVAMMLEPTPEIAEFKKNFGLVSGEDFGQFSLPSATGEKKVVFFETAPLCVSAHSETKEDAIGLFSKWYNKEHQTYLYNNFGFANTSQVSIEDPLFTQVLVNTSDADNYQLILRYYENTPEEIRNVALDEFMKLQMGNTSVVAMLEAIQAEADAYWNN